MTRIRQSQGGGYERRGKLFVRVTVAPGKRRGRHAPWAASLEQASARGKVVQGWVNRMRSAGQDEFIEKLVELAAKADDAAMAVLATRVDAFTGTAGTFERVEPPKENGGPLTFSKFGEQWTSGDLHRKHPDHVPAKKTAGDDEYRFEALKDIIGDVPVVSFTLDDADRAMARLDEVRRKRAGRDVKPLDAGGRRQYAQLIARTLKLAAYPARIIKASPLPPGWLPRVSNNKAKGLLYPDEEARTLGHTEHLIHWRVFFGFLARSGFRVDEAAGLTMKDVDLKRGIITLDENKTDDPRAPSYGPDLMIGLKMWAETHRKGAEPDDLFFPRPDGSRIPIDGLADFYREHYVRDAGVDRPELFVRSRSRLALRVHDLRGFFVTYALAFGATETWVMDRTGHKSSAMVNRYRRVARTVLEAGLPSPAPLHGAIPEFAAAKVAAEVAADPKKGRHRQRATIRIRRHYGPVAQSAELRTFNP